MSAREILFAVALAGAIAATVNGIAIISQAAAWIVGGVGFGTWSWLILGGVNE